MITSFIRRKIDAAKALFVTTPPPPAQERAVEQVINARPKAKTKAKAKTRKTNTIRRRDEAYQNKRIVVEALWITLTENKLRAGKTAQQMADSKNKRWQQTGRAILRCFGEHAEEITSERSTRNHAWAVAAMELQVATNQCTAMGGPISE